MEAWIAKREQETGLPNPIYTQGDWHGQEGVGSFTTSQQAYDTLHIGDPKQAARLQVRIAENSDDRSRSQEDHMTWLLMLQSSAWATSATSTLGVYQKHPDVKIVAVCDIIKERADKAAEQYGAPAFYSVQDMLASGIKIDAASMCTAGVENGGDHYKPTMELLTAGIPVLGEKPISNDIDQAPTRWWRWPRRRTCATASTSTTASPRPRCAPKNG